MTPTGNRAAALDDKPEAKFAIGDRVIYRRSWGWGAEIPGTIIGAGVEKGRAVYDVRLIGGAVHWGYADQFAPLPQTMEASNGR